MIYKLFKHLFKLLIADLDEDTKDRAWDHFLEITKMVATGAAEGAVRGAKGGV